MRLAGLIDTVTPLGDEAANPTLPVKPPRLVRLMVEVELEPAVKLTLAGLEVIVKSGTFTVTVTAWE